MVEGFFFVVLGFDVGCSGAEAGAEDGEGGSAGGEASSSEGGEEVEVAEVCNSEGMGASGVNKEGNVFSVDVSKAD